MAVQLLQARDARNQGSASSITVTLSVTATGSAYVGAVTYNGTADDVTTIVDDATNTLTKIATAVDSVNGQAVTSFWLKNIAGAGAPTVTVNFGGAHTFRAVAVHEVSGVDTTLALDNHAEQPQSAPGTGTDGVTSGTATVTDLCYVFTATQDSGTNATTHTAGTGFISDTTGTSADLAFSSGHTTRTGGTGSQAGTWTSSGNTAHVTVMVAMRAAGGFGTSSRGM